MWYAITGEDKTRQPRRRLRPTGPPGEAATLQNRGRLLLVSPFPAIDNENPCPAYFTGQLVAEFDSLESAQAWADADSPTLLQAFTPASRSNPSKSVACMITRFKILLGALMLLLVPPAEAETQYVNDMLRVDLRAGPTNTHKIIDFIKGHAGKYHRQPSHLMASGIKSRPTANGDGYKRNTSPNVSHVTC